MLCIAFIPITHYKYYFRWNLSPSNVLPIYSDIFTKALGSCFRALFYLFIFLGVAQCPVNSCVRMTSKIKDPLKHLYINTWDVLRSVWLIVFTFMFIPMLFSKKQGYCNRLCLSVRPSRYFLLHYGIFNAHQLLPADGWPGLTFIWGTVHKSMPRPVCKTPGWHVIAWKRLKPMRDSWRQVCIPLGYPAISAM